MSTLCQFYSETKVLTTPLIGDASITLIENGPSFFGVLLAESCCQDSWRPTLFLEGVTWFRASRHEFLFGQFGLVSLAHEQNLHTIRHEMTGKLFPNLSAIPHRTIFISAYDCNRLQRLPNIGKGSYFFRNIQHQFGVLPGFSAGDNRLSTPKGYAEVVPDNGLEMVDAA